MRLWLFASVMLLGCAGVQRVPLRSEVLPIADGRFIGPLEIPVPRRADHQGHDFEIEVLLRARCAPKFVLAFPDGETESLGEDDRGWQELLALRASALATPQPAPVPPALIPQEPSRGLDPLPYPGPVAPNTVVAVDAALVVPFPQQPAGHWETATTETWTGQLRFERERERRCAKVAEYRAVYLNAFDETGMLTLWAEVPQELMEGELSYRITELIPPKVDAPPPVKIEERVAVTVAVPPKKRPPAPEPRRESPRPAVETRATWTPGEWVWSEGQGEWVWHPGWWRAPSQPALQVEATGVLPNVGCTWASGYWTWERGEGKWSWQSGHWNAPPPLVDERGEPPGPGAPWITGSWSWSGIRFVWTRGRWGKPPLLVETPPAPPFSGSQWVRGDWILVAGRWVWSAGFYEGAQRPPPPRAEVAGVAPGPGAIWLQGYWRWDVTLTQHVWISSHWELPPGENYVWVAEPQGAGGLVIRGHWELRL